MDEEESLPAVRVPLRNGMLQDVYRPGDKMRSIVNRRQFVKTVGLGAFAGAGMGTVGAQAATGCE
jgi:hypothetical protein